MLLSTTTVACTALADRIFQWNGRHKSRGNYNPHPTDQWSSLQELCNWPVNCQSTLISPCNWILSNATTLSTYDTSNISFLFSLVWQVLGHSVMDLFLKLPQISKCQDFHYLLTWQQKTLFGFYSITRPLTSGPFVSPHRCRIYKPTKSNFFLQLL